MVSIVAWYLTTSADGAVCPAKGIATNRKDKAVRRRKMASENPQRVQHRECRFVNAGR
jgi:hypothetical protein